MTEQVLEAPRITVGFERKVSLRDYNSAVASVYVQAPTKPDMTPEETVAAIETAFFQAKVTVFDQLGIEFEVTQDGKAIELLEKELGAVEVVKDDGQVTRGPRSTDEAVGVARTSPNQANANVAPSTKRGLWEELSSNPKAYYDNRTNKKNPNGPDFKRKGTGEGLWLTYKGQPVKDAEGLRIPEPSEF